MITVKMKNDIFCDLMGIERIVIRVMFLKRLYLYHFLIQFLLELIRPTLSKYTQSVWKFLLYIESTWQVQPYNGFIWILLYFATLFGIDCHLFVLNCFNLCKLNNCCLDLFNNLILFSLLCVKASDNFLSIVWSHELIFRFHHFLHTLFKNW